LLVGAGGGVAAIAAAIVAVATLGSGGDDPVEQASLPAAAAGAETIVAVTQTTIGRDAFLFIQDCIDSDLFNEPFLDAGAPEMFYDGMGRCDEALKQLEADGLEADPLSAAIRDRLIDADALASGFDDGTAGAADHQAFADSGEGLYEEVYPMLRVLRGLDATPFFAEELAGEVADEPVDAGSEAPEITGYQTITDDTGVLTVDAPIEWGDVDTTPFTLDDGSESPMIMASPSIDDFSASYLTPGLFFTAVAPQESLEELLAEFAPSAGECTDAGIDDYDDSVYTGRYQTFTNCSESSTVFVTVAAVPPDNSFTAVVVMQLVSEADLVVLDQVFATFTVAA
jgi:hypothetical protein